MIEKIISRNVGVDSVKPGQIQTVNVDRVMIHDIFIPFVAEKFEEMGFTKLWDPDKVVLIYDHMVPASTTDDIRHFKIGDAFAKKYGMKNVHRSDGICHQLMTECETWEYRIRNRLSYNNLWLCWMFLFRNRLYRDGSDSWNRRDVGKSSRDDQSSH